ncbi:hypothetical protein [Breoghania sp.]|uniref:hypothetical protein n=1 Tax=Breoghania sp. TaxID=2065378 RepID=UPI002AA8A5E6|nr:hypothetical protein [Breoghania sp.]
MEELAGNCGLVAILVGFPTLLKPPQSRRRAQSRHLSTATDDQRNDIEWFIGIPFGTQKMKLAAISLAPVGKRVVSEVTLPHSETLRPMHAHEALIENHKRARELAA